MHRVRVVIVSLLWTTTQAAKYAPNHFLGSCLDQAWVDRVYREFGISTTDRDAYGRRMDPYLHAALKTPRFTVTDPRTAVPMSKLYQSDCMPATSVIYGVGATVDADGKVVDPGRVNGSLILELKNWPSIQLSTMAFAIIVQELFGYEISFFWTTDSAEMAERMSPVKSGLCGPVHANLEVWIDALLEKSVAEYSDDVHSTGEIGYRGRSGLYTTTQFVADGLDAAKVGSTFSADYWRDYASKDNLVKRLAASSLTGNTKYYPPTESGCVDGTLGCSNSCSKTKACVAREARGGECLVAVMMYAYYEPGYAQSVFDNNGIPATFCFIGLDAAQSFAIEALTTGKPVLFYHYEPDPFHFEHPDAFDRVMLPHSTPQEASKTTGEFGQRSNPVRVDYPYVSLQKYASSFLEINQPLESLLARMWVSDYDMNQLMKSYVSVQSAATPADDPEFAASCAWLKDNYRVWSLWLGRLPMCDLFVHIAFDFDGCEPATAAVFPRRVVFKWTLPHPDDSTQPYNCDGGLTAPPPTLVTSRSCEWLAKNAAIWFFWPHLPPACDRTFFTYNVSACDRAGSKREVRYRWLLESAIDAAKSAECTGGIALSEPVLLDCEFVPYDASSFTAIAALAIALALAILLAMAFVFHYRHQPVVKRSQYQFLLAMLLGGIFNCASVWLYAGEPTRLLCRFRSAGVALGFTLVFGSLVVKSLRVYRVFLSGAMKRVVLSAKTMFKILFVFLGVDAVILGAGNIADPSMAAAVAEATAQLGGDPVSSDFQESVWIFASALVVLFTSVIILALAYLVELPAITFYVFFALMLLLSTAIVMALMIVPKILRLNDRATDTGASSATAAGTRAAADGPPSDDENVNKKPSLKNVLRSSKRLVVKRQATQVQPFTSKKRQPLGERR
ncbi:hypothetical protein PybrP1_012134 [[Pythium] brassicae (nom. inval.)]|nr:hypothetical protein PybrP1_012134 [[Pythium] brassicae (nom. inval.)]